MPSPRFETPRLRVQPWHSPSPEGWPAVDLPRFVCRLLTPAVTAPLPPDWQGRFEGSRARAWIRERDREGWPLLVFDKAAGEPLGLLLVFQSSEAHAAPELRIGYLLAESAWGQGLASELLGGLVRWARDSAVASLVAGVAHDNLASRRVLEKNGFVQQSPRTEAAGEVFYELHLQGAADIPSPEDLQDPDGAAAWVEAADRKRPWRAEFRDAIAERLAGRRRILELGCGPGLLAQCVLRSVASVEQLVLFDFSRPMLAMCRERVGADPRAQLVQGDFREAQWVASVPGPFDAVISMQAIHELRHKRRAPKLYREVHGLLTAGGIFAVCDHVPRDASPFQNGLFMNESEQHTALSEAGFVQVQTVKSREGLLLYCAARQG